MSCFTFFFVSLFSFQGTPGGGQFALRFVLIVLGVRGVFPTALLASPSAFVSAAGAVFALASVASRAAPAVVGSNGLEPSTSRLSGVRSNHLSYEPMSVAVPVAIYGLPVSQFSPAASSLGLYNLLPCSSRRRGHSLSVCTFSRRDLPPVQLVVEMNRIELSTPCLQGRCSPN